MMTLGKRISCTINVRLCLRFLERTMLVLLPMRDGERAMHQTEYQYSNRKQESPPSNSRFLGRTSVENLPTRVGVARRSLSDSFEHPRRHNAKTGAPTNAVMTPVANSWGVKASGQ